MRQRISRRSAPRIHAYAASFGEDFARALIQEYARESSVVLDPFVGAGTTAVEAILSNRNAIGIDVDPIACRICRVLTARLDVEYLATSAEILRQNLKVVERGLASNSEIYSGLSPSDTFSVESLVFQVPSEPAIAYWFHPSHIAILSVIRGFISQERDPIVRQAFEIALSSCIIRKWPNTLSYAMDIDHSRPHKPKNPQIQTIQEQFALFYRVLSHITNTIVNIQRKLLLTDSSATILEGDSLRLLSELNDDSIEFVLTSPPYLNAIDYPRAHKFSQWWLYENKDPLTRSEYIGLRGAHTVDTDMKQLSLPYPIEEKLNLFRHLPIYKNIWRYISDLSMVIEQLYRVTQEFAAIAFVVANNVIAGIMFPVSVIVEALLEKSGFASVVSTPRAIKSTRRRYPFGINGFAGLMRDEYLVTATKPARQI